MKYRVEVGSFCTRLVERKIIVYADNADEASEKAIDEYWKKELELTSSVDAGTPQVDSVEEVV